MDNDVTLLAHRIAAERPVAFQIKLWIEALLEERRLNPHIVDKTNGNVLKSAGWKAPAKGVRGSVYDTSLEAVRQTLANARVST